MKLCLFHFTQNLREKAGTVVNAIRRAVGKTSEKLQLAEKTKRRLMMLPLLPERLITPQVVGLILRMWVDGCPEHRDAFHSVVATILRTYVGVPQDDPETPTTPRFPPELWSVSGMTIRTNNSAESLHSEINQKVSRKMSLLRFLSIIEECMQTARERIASGCQTENQVFNAEKNRLFAIELDVLLNGGQGVIAFLDNCSSISLAEMMREE